MLSNLVGFIHNVTMWRAAVQPLPSHTQTQNVSEQLQTELSKTKPQTQQGKSRRKNTDKLSARSNKQPSSTTQPKKNHNQTTKPARHKSMCANTSTQPHTGMDTAAMCDQQRLSSQPTGACACHAANQMGVQEGLLRELNPGPLAPEARIMPLDQAAS